jgi:hypothetical protein
MGCFFHHVRTDGRNTIPAHRSPESIEAFTSTLLMVYAKRRVFARRFAIDYFTICSSYSWLPRPTSTSFSSCT